uniref:ATP synthase complex subunit 8 n=1 Tax=Petrobiellus sp. 1 JZ-2014 TaxID=1529458 RepID=A0A0B4N5M0_9INSE|nr:ATP synthase subunit 8 [Petrobiellus sp. 1 JZ-2014]
MPQMSPLLWLTLYAMFLVIFIMFVLVNHYNLMMQPPKSTVLTNILMTTLNWKW